MTAPFAAWRVLSRPVAVPEGLRGTDRGTMAGGRDKRPCADRRYAVVVVEVFAVNMSTSCAPYELKALISLDFAVATTMPDRRATA